MGESDSRRSCPFCLSIEIPDRLSLSRSVCECVYEWTPPASTKSLLLDHLFSCVSDPEDYVFAILWTGKPVCLKRLSSSLSLLLVSLSTDPKAIDARKKIPFLTDELQGRGNRSTEKRRMDHSDKVLKSKSSSLFPRNGKKKSPLK